MSCISYYETKSITAIHLCGTQYNELKFTEIVTSLYTRTESAFNNATFTCLIIIYCTYHTWQQKKLISNNYE